MSEPMQTDEREADLRCKAVMEPLIDADLARRRITGWVSTEAVDRDGEVLLADGAVLDDYLRNPVVLFAHDSYAPPIGKALRVEVEPGRGVWAETEFAPTAAGEQMATLYAGGYLTSFSVGFRTLERGEPVKDGQTGSTIRRWDLREYSAVTLPANPEARAAAAKGLTDAAAAGIEIAPALRRWLLPEEPELGPEARVAAALQRLKGGAVSYANWLRHLRNAKADTEFPAALPEEVAAALQDLQEALGAPLIGKAESDPPDADTPDPEPAQAQESSPAADAAPDGALSDEVARAVIELASEARQALAARDETIAAAVARGIEDSAKAYIGGRR